MRDSVILCGWFGKQNTGDDAILLSELHALSNLGYRLIAVGEPQVLSKFGIQGVRHNDIAGLFRAISKSKVFILGGGGLIKSRSAIAYSAMLILSRALGSKPLVSGISVEKLEGALKKRLVKLAMTQSDSITVRDRDSLEVLSSLGVQNAIETSDWVFLYPADERARERENYAVVALREWNHEDLRSASKDISFEKYMAILSRICDSIISKYSLRIILLPFQTGKQESDVNDLIYLRNLVSNKDSLQVIDAHLHPDQILQIIAKSRFVIAMRLHSLIMSTITCTPFIGISYSAKVRAFGKKTLADNMIELSELSYERLSQLVSKCMAEGDSLNTELRRIRDKQRLLAMINVDEIVKAIHKA